MRKNPAAIIGIGIISLVLAFTTFAAAQQTGKQILKVNGAGMASDQVDKWAKEFMETNPDVSVTVIGSSAGKGFQALVDGTADIAMMSREVRSEERTRANEKGLKLVEKPIGRAAIALITHRRNPVNELSLEQVRKLYTGQYDNWKQVGGPDEPVRCLSRKIPESGGAVFFWEKVMNGADFGKNTVLTETWEVILKVCSVAQDLPLGIVPQTRNLSGVKALAIAADEKSAPVMPKDENLKNGTYPITLPFFFVWDERSNMPGLLKFVEFCRSHGGL